MCKRVEKINWIYPKCLYFHQKRFKVFNMYTDKKENKIFLIYKEIQMGAVAMSCMTKYLRISSYIRKPFLIYDFVTAPI